MSLRCFFGFHEPGGLVGRGNRLSVKCCRCDRISHGIAIDGPAPRPLLDLVPKAKSRIWWVKAVYVREA